MVDLVELDTAETVREHANLFMSLPNQVRREFGDVIYVYRAQREAVIKQVSTGRYYDVELDDETGELRVCTEEK